jgi:hypothetical protein
MKSEEKNLERKKKMGKHHTKLTGYSKRSIKKEVYSNTFTLRKKKVLK